MDLRNTRTTILNQGDAEEKREEIRQYFHATFSLDEQLYETLAAEERVLLAAGTAAASPDLLSRAYGGFLHQQAHRRQDHEPADQSPLRIDVRRRRR